METKTRGTLSYSGAGRVLGNGGSCHVAEHKGIGNGEGIHKTCPVYQKGGKVIKADRTSQ